MVMLVCRVEADSEDRSEQSCERCRWSSRCKVNLGPGLRQHANQGLQPKCDGGCVRRWTMDVQYSGGRWAPDKLEARWTGVVVSAGSCAKVGEVFFFPLGPRVALRASTSKRKAFPFGSSLHKKYNVTYQEKGQPTSVRRRWKVTDARPESDSQNGPRQGGGRGRRMAEGGKQERGGKSTRTPTRRSSQVADRSGLWRVASGKGK